MKLLVKQALISDTNSPHNGLLKDILVENGIIKNISNKIEEPADRVIEHPGLRASAGWVDIFAHFCDPGFEHKETLETGANAAAAGGYVHAFALPDTQPQVTNKVQVEYVVQKSKMLPANIYPLGTITKNGEGKDLAEMYDMRNSGAIAFTDGLNPVQTPGLFLKALQYVKAFNGVLIQQPIDTSIGRQGLMNEGVTSTRLGLPGLPAISEELMVARDIELSRYTDSRLHITGISTLKSIQLIKKAKQQGVKVTCSVTPYHLFFSDEDLHQYDTNLKVNPPLRSREDVIALRKAVEDGVVDCIATHHIPQDWDNKVCEFEYAKYGMIGLESCFSVINTIFHGMSVEKLVSLLSSNARQIFRLPNAVIEEGNGADITLFETETNYTFDLKHIKSKSANSAFIGKRLKGKVIGIINKDKLYLNE